MSLERAARIDDHIGHSHKKEIMAVGGAVAIAIGAAATIVSGGSALEIVIGAVSLSGDIADVVSWAAGKVADALPRDEKAAVIKTAARRTWTENKRSARITDELVCGDPAGTMIGMTVAGTTAPGFIFLVVDLATTIAQGGYPGEHPGAFIADGSKTVFIEDRNAARVHDGTDCGGSISSGAGRTLIGGERVMLSGTDVRLEEGAGLHYTFKTIEILGNIAVPLSLGFQAALKGVEISMYLHSLALRAAGFNREAELLEDSIEYVETWREIARTGKATPKGKVGVIVTVAKGAKTISEGMATPPPPRPTVSYPRGQR